MEVRETEVSEHPNLGLGFQDFSIPVENSNYPGWKALHPGKLAGHLNCDGGSSTLCSLPRG